MGPGDYRCVCVRARACMCVSVQVCADVCARSPGVEGARRRSFTLPIEVWLLAQMPKSKGASRSEKFAREVLKVRDTPWPDVHDEAQGKSELDDWASSAVSRFSVPRPLMP